MNNEYAETSKPFSILVLDRFVLYQLLPNDDLHNISSRVSRNDVLVKPNNQITPSQPVSSPIAKRGMLGVGLLDKLL